MTSLLRRFSKLELVSRFSQWSEAKHWEQHKLCLGGSSEIRINADVDKFSAINGGVVLEITNVVHMFF